MSDVRQTITATAERLRALEIREIVYFHCDHFEPWDFSGRTREVAAESVATFVDEVGRHEFGRRLTLFYSNPLVVELAPRDDLLRASPDDALGFVRRSEKDHDTLGAPFRYMRAHSGHEIQIHLHHENFTWTRGMRDAERAAYLQRPEARALDGPRIERAIEEWLACARREFDYAPSRWFFVHGLWSLNGSDPEGCNVHDEIARLMKLGCRGDFTFPAGRPHCDPRTEAPYFCAPATGPKSYDSEAAHPEFAWGNGAAAADKFFVWNSPIKASAASLDWGDHGVRAKLAEPEPFAREIVERSFRWDGVLYIKTHAHSMHRMNRDGEGRLIHPHCYGPALDLYGAIFDGAATAGAAVTFATAGEVYDRFVTAQPPAVTPSLASFRPSIVGRELGFIGPNNERVLETAARVDALAVAAMAARIAELGVSDSGAEAHYASLVERGSVMPKHDLRAAQILLTQFGADRAIHEIGTGIGVLPLLLSALEIPALGIESANRRYDACRAVEAHVARHWDGALAPHDYLLGRFPECLDGEDLSDKVVVISDFTCTMSEAERRELIQALRGYGAVLLDLDRFIRRGDGSIAARKALVDELKSFNLGTIYDADISSDFAFVLIVNNPALIEAETNLSPAPAPAADADLDRIFAVPLTGAPARDTPAKAECRSRLRALKKRVLIVAPSRTGSEYLSSLLRGIGVDCEEFLNPRSSVSRGRSIAPGQDPAAFIGTLCHTVPNGILCTKEGVHTLTPLFAVGEFPDHIDEWRFIYMVRRNVVRQAVSLLLAEQTGQWRQDFAPEKPLRRDKLTFSAVAEAMNQIFIARDLATRFFAVFGIAPLEIAYEDLVASPAACLERIAEFIGLPNPGPLASTQPAMQPRAQSTELNRQIEDAFKAELHRRLTGDGAATELLLPVPESEPEGTEARIPLASPFKRELGQCWICPLDSLRDATLLTDTADNDAECKRSRADLWEDGIRLGPPHAAHATIRQTGRGAFSHWKRELYFSTSDNSDPNVNGRRYELRLRNTG